MDFLNIDNRQRVESNGSLSNIIELAESARVDDVIGLMNNNNARAMFAIREYDTKTHGIFTDPRRQDKLVVKKKGDKEERDLIKRAKLPLSYQKYINEISIVFLYGQPVTWLNESDVDKKTDNAYRKFINVIKNTRFDSKIRECKRLAGSETESALFFRVYRNNEGKADIQLRVLANSKKDRIYTLFDIYDNLIAFAWGYDLKEGEENEVIPHFDLYLPNVVYKCSNKQTGWSVTKEANLIGKIPVVYFEQQKEWHGVEELIEREEYIHSRTADTNDYFSDPHLMVKADAIKNLSQKDTENKTMVVNSEGSINDSAKYLTWDSAPQSKKDEIEQLQKLILMMSFTPQIDFDNMKGLSNVTGKALKQMMLLADIKANKHKEKHDEYLSRISSLLRSIIGNVLDVSLKSECDNLEINHHFNEPFGEDATDLINNIVRSVDSGILSEQGAIELNPLVKNPIVEMERIEEETGKSEERKAKQQADLFGDGELYN